MVAGKRGQIVKIQFYQQGSRRQRDLQDGCDRCPFRHTHLPEEMAQLAQDVTLHTPSIDSNSSRWPLHPLWPVAQDAVATRLCSHEARVPPEAVREVDLQAKSAELFQQNGALPVRLAYLDGLTHDVFEVFAAKFPMRILRFLEKHPRGLQERVAVATVKYVALYDP